VTGIEVRHRTTCARTKRKDARCTCKRPSFRGVVWSKAEGKNLYGHWGPRSEAIAWRAQAQRELSLNGSLAAKAPTGPTVAQTAGEFLADVRSGKRRDRKGKVYKPSTIRGYERGLAKIKAELGNYPLAELRRTDVQRFVDGLEGAPSTIRNTLDPLRAIYRHALKRELVVVNPTTDLDMPDDEDEDMRIASREEAAALVAALPELERAFWSTALYAGLRSGELRALRWSDVDLDNRLIHVRRSWDDGGEAVLPKTNAGRRRVPVVPRLAKALERHRALTERDGDALVFGATEAKPLERCALTAWKTAELEPITVHQCRHTCASFLIASGLNAKAVSTILGHASISITFDRYGHLMPGSEDEARDRLDAYINGA
jgi:integrase